MAIQGLDLDKTGWCAKCHNYAHRECTGFKRDGTECKCPHRLEMGRR